MANVACIDRARCIGCGLCAAACPNEAMRMRQKQPDEQYVPPANVVETCMTMARERGLI